jgi:long-chain fatty acid transport protein
MKLKHLSTAMILATLPATGVFAAALDRSGQSMAAFFQPGNYFEAGLSVLDPTVEGQEAGKTPAPHDQIKDMADDYYFPTAAVKVQFNDKFSFGLLYDQPFGAAATYSGNNIFVANGADKAFSPALEAVIMSQARPTFDALTAEQRVGAALKAQGVDLSSTTGQAIYQGTLAKYKTPEASVENSVVKSTIDAGVLAAVNSQYRARIDQANTTVQGVTGATSVDVDTESLSMVFGFSPIKNITLYAGPVYQLVKGDISLRGSAYSVYNGYDLHIKNTEGWGWLAGAAYQIPEIALKASLTYRSEIDHDVKNATETGYEAIGALYPTEVAAIKNGSGTTTVTTPQSVNIDLQSGIMADTVAFANIRWVNWKDFAVQPYKFGQISKLATAATGGKGFNLVEYSDDQYSVTAGVGRKLNEKWAGNVSVGWDSGAGNPVTTLGPTEGYWNLGVGMQYSPASNYFIAGGVKYFWLGDAKAQSGADAGTDAYLAEFKDNHAIAYGMKIGYRF